MNSAADDARESEPRPGLTSYQLSDRVEADIANSTIGFLHLGMDSSGQNAESAGSGTLVKIGPFFGVLSAAHVLEGLPRDGPIGLVTFNRPDHLQRSTIRGQWDAVALRVAENGPDGPDIGFMRLPEFNVSHLRATHTFVELGKPGTLVERSVADKDEPVIREGHLFAGVVGEWTAEMEPVQPINSAQPLMRRKRFPESGEVDLEPI